MKKFLITFICVVLLITTLTASVSALSEDDYVYYTDLFYAYPYYLANDPYFLSYQADLSSLVSTVYYNYTKSAEMYGTAFNFALDTATSPIELLKTISDTVGLTNYGYHDALDLANQMIVKNLLEHSVGESVSDSCGKVQGMVGNVKRVIDYTNKLAQLDGADDTVESALQDVLNYMQDSGMLSCISDSMLAQLYADLCEENCLSDALEVAGNAVSFVKGISVAIMMEEMRIEIIDNILQTQTTDTVLKDGMTRLKNQLTKGFVGYFLDNYVGKQLLKDILGCIDKIAVELLDAKAMFKLVKVVNFVVFDVLWDVPSYENVMALQVLMYYMSDLNAAHSAKVQEFANSPTISDKIIAYEDFVTFMEATGKAMMGITAELEQSSNPFKGFEYLITEVREHNAATEDESRKIKNIKVTDRFQTTEFEVDEFLCGEDILYYLHGRIQCGATEATIDNGKQKVTINLLEVYYYDLLKGTAQMSSGYVDSFNATYTDLYNSHIASAKATVAAIPESERVAITKEIYSNWTYDIENVHLKSQSDSVEKNCVYAAEGKIRGNVTVSNTLTVDENTTVTIDGTLYVPSSFTGGYLYNYGNLTVTEDLNFDGTIHNCGTLIIQHKLINYIDKIGLDPSFINHGVVKCQTFAVADANWYIFDFSDNSKIYVSGSFDLYNGQKIMIPQIIFNGTEQQNVRNLSAKNIVVENPNGLKYFSDVYVYGLYSLNNNPIENNGFKTVVFDGARFDGSFYYNVASQNLVLRDNIKVNELSIIETLTIDNETSIIIDGTLYVPSSFTGGYLYNYGNLTVTEDLNFDGTIHNCGTLIIQHKLINYIDKIGLDPSFINHGVVKCQTFAVADANWYIFDFSDNSKIYVSGSFDLCNGQKIMIPQIIFNGTKQQKVKNLSAKTIIIQNNSAEGVVFDTNITASILFDHNGNNFTLYNNGSGSTFVDYDGDGIKDHIDPYPTMQHIDGRVVFDGVVYDNNVVTNCDIGERSVYIKKSATAFTEDAFKDCPLLEKIHILSRNVVITDSAEAIPLAAVIYGYAGSTAEAYANKYRRTFVALDEESDEPIDGSLVAYQVTEGEYGTFSLRTISGFNSLKHVNYGFEIAVTTKDSEGNDVVQTFFAKDDKVYSSIFGGTTEYSIKDTFGYEYAGLATLTRLDLNSTYTKIEIWSYVTAEDGEETYGIFCTFLYTGETNADGFPALSVVTE